MTLTWDNGEGLEFRRTIAVDDKYHVHASTTRSSNKGTAPVTLYPYALISRHGTPKTHGYYILHEGLIGVLGQTGPAGGDLQRHRGQEEPITFKVTNAAGSASPTNTGPRPCCPTPMRASQARFSSSPTRRRTKTYQTDYLLDAQTDRAGRDRRGQ